MYILSVDHICMQLKLHISVVTLYIVCGRCHRTMRLLHIYLLRGVGLCGTGLDNSGVIDAD
jgi:hypothetical protein